MASPGDMEDEKATAVNEAKAFDRITAKGKDDGLFRQCMKQIRGSHSTGQALRLGLVATGLLSDLNCYVEALIQFYVCTKALDERLQSSSSPLVAKVRDALGKYAFVTGYEADLQQLLGSRSWAADVAAKTSRAADDYCRKLRGCGDCELVAAVFVLYGALIIGGGAAMEPRVKKRFGAVSLFRNVIGPGREERKSEFIALYDALLSESDGAAFGQIVASAGAFMDMNNALMMGMQRRPYWYYPLGIGLAAIAGSVAWIGIRSVSRRGIL